ncbi:MAG: 4Fe-4S binding protein [Alphaproteobacteria bacterium]|nr:4Fe-4S binding protein [Alphaproteobacteria bacterium]MDP6517158.1 4Fe-4S binding protein [Alphaproteobacteria bacterium]
MSWLRVALPARLARDLGDWAPVVEGFFVRHRHRLPIVHAAMLLLFLALILLPPLTERAGEQDGPFDNYRLFANLVLWGLWFPLVFASVVLTGRSWCGLLCPMGAASEWANGRGLKRAIPGWVKWPGTPVVSFIVVTIWAQTLGTRDHAQSAAILFGGMMLVAIALGFVCGRKNRAWCRHMCPIGLLLGVYSRLGAVTFRPKHPVDGGDRWTEATNCPTMIDLKRKTESRHCIECFRCVHPKAKGGLALVFRRPGAEVETIRHRNPNLSEVMFLFLGAGVALGGFLWMVLDSYQDLRLWVATAAIKRGWLWIGEPGPSWLMAVFPEEREIFRWIDFLTISAYMSGWMVLTAGVLAATSGLAAWLSGRMGGNGTFRQRFLEFGYQVAPVAMVSLLLGLGGELFAVLGHLGLTPEGTHLVKLALFAAGGLWSLHLGVRLLHNQGVPARRRWAPLLAGATGTFYVGAVWYPAVFGL